MLVGSISAFYALGHDTSEAYLQISAYTRIPVDTLQAQEYTLLSRHCGLRGWVRKSHPPSAISDRICMPVLPA